MAKFIKVTPKGEKESRIVLATLKSFYLAQGAKIEIPTDEEVWAAEPSERPRNAGVPAGNTAAQAKEVAELKRTLAEVRKNAEATIAEHESTIKEQAETIAELREKLDAANLALEESENVIASLQEKVKTKKVKGDAAE